VRVALFDGRQDARYFAHGQPPSRGCNRTWQEYS
jgi:hypothetical protein